MLDIASALLLLHAAETFTGRSGPFPMLWSIITTATTTFPTCSGFSPPMQNAPRSAAHTSHTLLRGVILPEVALSQLGKGMQVVRVVGPSFLGVDTGGESRVPVVQNTLACQRGSRVSKKGAGKK
jgi:hypothetical protein